MNRHTRRAENKKMKLRRVRNTNVATKALEYIPKQKVTVRRSDASRSLVTCHSSLLQMAQRKIARSTLVSLQTTLIKKGFSCLKRQLMHRRSLRLCGRML